MSMFTQEKQIVAKKVLFWSLLGPFLIISTLFTLLFKVSAGHFYIPLAALIGVPVCWYWKTRGLAIVLGSFFLFLAVHYYRFSDHASAWNIGLATALALAFVVTTFSFKEMENLFGSFSASLPLPVADDKEKVLWQEERASLALALAESQELTCSQEKLIELSREEVIALHNEKEMLHEKLAGTLAELGKLEENYEDLIQERHRLVQEARQPGESEAFKQRLSEKEKQLEQLRILLDKANSKLGQLEGDHSRLEKMNAEYNEMAESVRQTQLQQESIQQQQNEKIEDLTREKCLLESVLAKLQEQLEQAKSQYELSKQHLELSTQELQSLRHASFEEKIHWELTSNQLQEQVEKAKKLHEQSTQELQSLRHASFEEKILLEVALTKLQEEIEEAKKQHEQSTQELQSLRLASFEEKILLEVALTKLQEEIEGAKKQVPVQDSEQFLKWRRAEGMYNQLREQFEEKSATLDATRKELFLTQEALLALQHDVEEQSKYSVTDEEQALLKLQQQSADEIDKLQAEIAALEKLIAHLMDELD